MALATHRTARLPLACVAACLSGALLPAPALGQAEVVSRIDTNLYVRHLTNLFTRTGQNRGFTYPSQSSTPRVPANQHDPARDYIFNRFTAFGLATTLDAFSFSTRFRKGGTSYIYQGCNNVIAIKPGRDPVNDGIYVIGAYYDAVDPGQPLPDDLNTTAPLSPAADENGSGVAGLLAIAEALSPQTFKATLVFIAFDASEKNFGGAAHYVNTLTTTNAADTNRLFRGRIRGMVSLDTIAYNPPGANANVALISGGDSTGASTPTNAAIRTALGAAVGEFANLPVYQATATYWSDHLYFQDVGVDSCVLEERNIWANPYAYGLNDSVDTAGYLDYAYAVKLTRALAGYLCRQAGLVYNLAAGTLGSGSVSGTGAWLDAGSRTTLVANAAAYWRFAGWTGDTNGCFQAGNVITAVMDQARSLTAVFEEKREAMGTPDAWLAAYGLTNLPFAQEELLDRDGDGAAAWQEYVASTDPADGRSFLHFVAISNRPAFTAYFVSATGRLYTLDYTTNLVFTNGWSAVPGRSDIQGSGGMMGLSATNAGGPRFFRVRVRLPP